MKRNLLALILTLAMATSLALTVTGCGKDTSLTVYAAGDFIKQDLINDFSEETGITVNYITGTRTPPDLEQPEGDSSADSSALVKAEEEEAEKTSVDILSELRSWKQEDTAARAEQKQKNSKKEPTGVVCDYDVILTDFDTASQLRDEACLRELSETAIPNMKLLNKGWLQLNGEQKHHYALPVLYGTAGLLWNTKLIDYQVTSWKSLWRHDYKGKVVMPDNPRDCAAPALLIKGYDVNTNDEKQLRNAYNILKKQTPLVAGYSDGVTYTMMETGAAAITVAYSGAAIQMMSNNRDLAYILPKEGTWRMCYTYSIPAGSEWPEEAEKFINYMCSASNLAKNAVYSKYSATSKAAYDKLDKAWQKNPLAYPGREVRKKARLIQGLEPKAESLHSQLFQDLIGQTAPDAHAVSDKQAETAAQNEKDKA